MKTVSIEELYNYKEVAAAAQRYNNVREGFLRKFCKGCEQGVLDKQTAHGKQSAPDDQPVYFSAPGRCEIIGNHTDHNGGKVIAASINMDTIAAAAPNGTDIINVYSEEYGDICVELGELNQKVYQAAFEQNKSNESNVYTLGSNHNLSPSGSDNCISKLANAYTGSAALIVGICEAAVIKGYSVGGFDAYVSTQVIAAAGVSSSASFEMLICAIINFLFNDNKMTENDCAHFGQYAENKYWNKASGLMDQIACAAGGAVYMDFSDRDNVRFVSTDVSFEQMGYKLVLINTGKGHADLGEEYSSIPREMYGVANALGCERLCETSREELLKALKEEQFEPDTDICGKLASDELKNDRAILRALHFFDENDRVDAMQAAINSHDTERMLELIEQSGKSSWELLQNCYCDNHPEEQKIPLALALTENFFKQMANGVSYNHDASHISDVNHIHGVCRIHGGGFAGVIMSVIPIAQLDEYVAYMSHFFNRKDIHPIDVRGFGAVKVEL